MSFKIFFKGFAKGFRSFGHSIVDIVNFVLLLAVYFVGVGPTWFVSRLAGKKFLDLTLDPDKESYWETLNLRKMDEEEYYRQF